MLNYWLLCASGMTFNSVEAAKLWDNRKILQIDKFSKKIDVLNLKEQRIFEVNIFDRKKNTFFKSFYKFPVKFSINGSVFSLENAFFKDSFININTFVFMTITERELTVGIERKKLLIEPDIKVKMKVDIDESKIDTSVNEDELHTAFKKFTRKNDSFDSFIVDEIECLSLWLDEVLRTYQAYTFKISSIKNGLVTEPFIQKMISMKTRLLSTDFNEFSLNNIEIYFSVLYSTFKQCVKKYWDMTIRSCAFHIMLLFDMSKKDVEGLLIK